MTRDEVVDVLTMVAAGDRRTVGQADVTFWGTILNDDQARVTKPEAAAAVLAHFRDRPGVWLEPGHIVESVRAARRDRLAREPDEVREARQDALAAKAREDMAALAERKGLPVPDAPQLPRKSRQHGVNPLIVKCQWCKAGVGARCVVPATGLIMVEVPGTWRTGFHPCRWDDAKAKVNT